MESYKIVLVGDSGVGKTPFIHVYNHQSPPPPSSVPSSLLSPHPRSLQ